MTKGGASGSSKGGKKRESKNIHIAVQFIEAFAIGQTFSAPAEFDLWGFKTGHLPKTSANPGDVGWEHHIKQRSKLKRKINGAARSTSLERQFKIRVLAPNSWRVFPLHRNVIDEWRLFPDRVVARFNRFKLEIGADAESLDWANVPPKATQAITQLLNELSFIESDFDHSLGKIKKRITTALE